MAKVLAIDPGCRNSAYAVLDKGSLIYSEPFTTTAQDFYTPFYLQEHRAKFDEILTKFDPDLVALEGPSIASGNLQFAIGGLHAIYTFTALEADQPMIIVPPMKWKKYVIGKGDATKKEIALKIRESFKEEFEGRRVKQDVYDAIAISIFAEKALSILNKTAEALTPLEVQLFTSSKGVLGSSSLNFNLDKLWQKNN